MSLFECARCHQGPPVAPFKLTQPEASLFVCKACITIAEYLYLSSWVRAYTVFTMKCWQYITQYETMSRYLRQRNTASEKARMFLNDRFWFPTSFWLSISCFKPSAYLLSYLNDVWALALSGSYTQHPSRMRTNWPNLGRMHHWTRHLPNRHHFVLVFLSILVVENVWQMSCSMMPELTRLHFGDWRWTRALFKQCKSKFFIMSYVSWGVSRKTLH